MLDIIHGRIIIVGPVAIVRDEKWSIDVVLWNSLPIEVVLSATLDAFKENLITLYSNYLILFCVVLLFCTVILSLEYCTVIIINKGWYFHSLTLLTWHSIALGIINEKN